MIIRTRELRKMTEEELKMKKKELEEELFSLRYKKGLMQLENVHIIRDTKRAIARINTLLTEVKLGIRPLSNGE